VAPSTSSDLSDQLRLIEAARAAVAARKPAAAASAIADYRGRFPRGAFDQEASVLQIQTLDLQGNHARAAEQARSFLARYPKSPHVAVVHRIAER
jgi:TolA-binding protein